MAVQTQDVKFPAGKRTLPAYLARPAGPGPFPGVVVIHEIFGLNENIKDIARRLAGEGYAALAVDLFAGQNRAVCMARFMAANLSGKRRIRIRLARRHSRPEGGADLAGRPGGDRRQAAGCDRLLPGRRVRHHLGRDG